MSSFHTSDLSYTPTLDVKFFDKVIFFPLDRLSVLKNLQT